MATIKLLLGVLCFAVTGSIGLFNRNLLVLPAVAYNPQRDHRAGLVEIAKHEIGIREKTGHNDGSKVESYLACVQLKKGQPWCAAFVSWIYAREGLPKPRSGWSPDMFPSSRLARSAIPGNVLGIYFPELKRIAHVGLIVLLDGQWVTSIEGNTNVSGSREGDGVYKKRRHVKTIYRIADWVKEREK